MKAALLHLALMLNLCSSGLVVAQDSARFLPNPKLTPGDTLNTSKDDLCVYGYSSPAQKIPMRLKIQVFEGYGISATAVGYNVDHLIPVDLGGSNSMKNLWPQPLSGEWNYGMKNRLEKRLRKLVCSGELELEKAQREIAADWIAAYRKYMVNRRQGSRH
ncbi:MAG TPA: HNH endonuclease [Blastocatellia bacterium]|nr:HNH endonuclease [Blastocatellia bacterium]